MQSAHLKKIVIALLIMEMASSHTIFSSETGDQSAGQPIVTMADGQEQHIVSVIGNYLAEGKEQEAINFLNKAHLDQDDLVNILNTIMSPEFKNTYFSFHNALENNPDRTIIDKFFIKVITENSSLHTEQAMNMLEHEFLKLLNGLDIDGQDYDYEVVNELTDIRRGKIQYYPRSPEFHVMGCPCISDLLAALTQAGLVLNNLGQQLLNESATQEGIKTPTVRFLALYPRLFNFDPNQKVNDADDTLLLLAVKAKHVALVKELLVSGADPLIPNKAGQTAFSIILDETDWAEDKANLLMAYFLTATRQELGQQESEANVSYIRQKLTAAAAQAKSHGHDKASSIELSSSSETAQTGEQS